MKIDNSVSGYDKKFSCYATPINNAVSTLGTTFPVNAVKCSKPMVMNIPLIFDNMISLYSSLQDDTFIDYNTNLTGIILFHLDPITINYQIVSTKEPIPTILANVLSIFTTLLTVFMTFKKFSYKRTHKNELAQKMLELNDIIITQDSIETQNTDQKNNESNITLATIRNESNV